jgi:hypothetical protein
MNRNQINPTPLDALTDPGVSGAAVQLGRQTANTNSQTTPRKVEYLRIRKADGNEILLDPAGIVITIGGKVVKLRDTAICLSDGETTDTVLVMRENTSEETP